MKRRNFFSLPALTLALVAACMVFSVSAQTGRNQTKRANKTEGQPSRPKQMTLEFWPTFECSELIPQLEEADSKLGKGTATKNPLSSILQFYGLGPVVGYAKSPNMKEVERLLEAGKAKGYIARNARFLWGAKPVDEEGELYELYAVRVDGEDGRASIDGSHIAKVAVEEAGNWGYCCVDLTFNKEGSDLWARMTRENIGRSIAIVLGGVVYAAPTVQNEITGGRAAIPGNYSKREARAIASRVRAAMSPKAQ